jgi:hypothetical protein
MTALVLLVIQSQSKAEGETPMVISLKIFLAQVNLSKNFVTLTEGVNNGFIIYRIKNRELELNAQVDTKEFEWVSQEVAADGTLSYTGSK